MSTLNLNRIDLSRVVLAPSGIKLAAHDALRNALYYLSQSDTDCAYVRAARGLLGAVMADIKQQEGKQ